MSEVLSFRLPKELKKKMENLKDIVDRPSELRAFVEERVKVAERSPVIKKILERSPEKIFPAGSVAKAIREEREGA